MIIEVLHRFENCFDAKTSLKVSVRLGTRLFRVPLFRRFFCPVELVLFDELFINTIEKTQNN